MSDAETRAASTGIIFKVSVICGCQLPTHDAHINALEGEFLIFLNEFGYEKLTVEEILTAFRMNANFQLEKKVETYGTVFNVDYASKVLSQYKEQRFRLDIKLSDMHRKIEADKILAEEEKSRKEKIKQQFEKYLADKNAELDLENAYMQLDHDNAFLEKHFYLRFLNGKHEHPKEGFRPVRGLHDVRQMFREYDDYLDKQFDAQKLAVKYLFKHMILQGKKEIYDASWNLMYPGFPPPLPPEKEIKETEELPF